LYSNFSGIPSAPSHSKPHFGCVVGDDNLDLISSGKVALPGQRNAVQESRKMLSLVESRYHN